MPDRSLDSLSSEFKPLALEWIARCIERKVAVLIVQTSRTEAEHAANLAAGTSGTNYSLHLPRRLRPATLVGYIGHEVDDDKADAMDLAPYAQYLQHGPEKINWDSRSWEFEVIAAEAEKLGLRSGVRWSRPFDPGHAEFVLPVKAPLLVAERARPWPTFRTA